MASELLPIFILIYLIIGIIIVRGFVRFASERSMRYGNMTLILTILLWPYIAAMSANEAIQGFKEIFWRKSH